MKISATSVNAPFAYRMYYDVIARGIEKRLVSGEYDARHFYFFSVDGEDVCITFNEGDIGFVTILKNKELIYYGFPLYDPMCILPVQISSTKISELEKRKMIDAFGDECIVDYVDSVVSTIFSMRR